MTSDSASEETTVGKIKKLFSVLEGKKEPPLLPPVVDSLTSHKVDQFRLLVPRVFTDFFELSRTFLRLSSTIICAIT